MPKKLTEDGEIVDVVTDEIIARPPPFFKTPWNHDTDAESNKGTCDCKDPSKTQQQFAKEADINNILAKFLQTGEPPPTIGEPTYGDQDNDITLQDIIVTRAEVEAAWEALPARVRNTLKDPDTFVRYIDHAMATGELDDLRDLGLAKPKPAEPAVTPGGVSPAPQPPKEAPSASQSPASPGNVTP